MQPPNYGSPLVRALYDSPLHTRRGRIALGLIAAIVFLPAVHSWKGWLTPIENGKVLLVGVFFALLGSMLGLLFLRYLDRRDPEPWALRAGALLMAGLVAPAAAAFFNGHSPYVLLTVGFNEEFWKVFTLLFIVVFAPRVVNGVRDGIIYGALGGFGFNIIELAVYVLRVSYPQDGLLVGTTHQLSRLGWWGIGNHVIWSALVGAGIGYAIQNPSSRWRFILPIGIYTLAAVTHDLQDAGVGVLLMVLISAGLMSVLGGKSGQPAPSVPSADAIERMQQFVPTAIAFEAIAINVVCLPILLYALVRSGDWERRIVRDQLASEQPPVVTQQELDGIRAEKRFRLRTIPGYPKAKGRAIRNAQNALAFQKEYLAQRGRPSDRDPLAQYLRSVIAGLRSS